MEHPDLLFAQSCADDAPGVRQQLVATYNDCVRRTVASVLLRNNGSANIQWMIEDITQDIFVSLFEENGKKLRSFRADNGCSLKTWICTVAARRTINELRKEAIRQPSQTDDAEAFPFMDETEKKIYISEIVLFFRSFLSALTDKDRLIFRLIFEDEVGYKEAAVVCRMTTGALYTRVSRVKALLRDQAKKCGLL